MHDLVPLHLLDTGQVGHIGQVVGLPGQVQRLEELGLRGGAKVEVVRAGTPCIIRLSGQKLCFRADDLLNVLVRLASS